MAEASEVAAWFDYVAEVTLPALEGWLELAQGHLARATALSMGALDWAEIHDLRPHHGALDALVTAAWCHIGAGDLAAAEAMVEAARLDADLLGWDWDLFRAGLVAIELRRLRLGPGPALALLDDLRRSLAPSPASYFAAQLDQAEAVALVDIGLDEAHGAVDRLGDGPRRRLLLARLLEPGSAPNEAAMLLARRTSWPLPLRLEAELLLGAREAPGRLRNVSPQLWPRGPDRAGFRLFLATMLLSNKGCIASLCAASIPGWRRAWDAQTTTKPASPAGSRPDLTDRERSVLELLPTHLSYAQIGNELYLSVNTVKSALKIIYRKLDAGTRNEAVDVARASGLL